MRCEPGMQENKNFTRFSFLKWSRQASTEPAKVLMIKQQSRSQRLVCSSQFLVLKKSAFCFIFYFLGFASFQTRGRCTHCSPLEVVFDLTILFYKNFLFSLFLETRRQLYPLACIFHFLHLGGCILTQNLISWKYIFQPHSFTINSKFSPHH